MLHYEYPNSPYYFGGGSASANVTATFIWIPDPNNPSEPPTPLCVLETASASALTGLDTPSADDGLNDTATLGPTSAYSQGSHLTLAGTTSPIILTHTLSTTCPNGETMQLSYQATGYPVTLALPGTTYDSSDGSANILIGQGCTGILSGGGGTLSDWLWSVPGDTFAGFAMAADQSWGHALTTDASTWVQPTPHWYWKKGTDSGDEKTVSCTATVTPPVGEGDPFTVTATKQVKVWNPHYEIKDIELGTPTIVGNTLSSGDPTDKDGFWMQGVAATPEMFTSAGTGNWCWAQLCKLYRHYGPFGEGTKLDDYVLDSSFPYNTDANAGDTGGALYDAGLWAFIAPPLTFHAFLDTPVVGFYPLTGYVDVNDAFKLYLMYRPPSNGAGVDWVPLLMQPWGWDAYITRAPGIDDWPANPGEVYSGNHEDYPDFLSWNDAFLSGR